MRRCLRWLVTPPGLATAAAGAAVVCALLAYAQAGVNDECVTAAVCLTKQSRLGHPHVQCDDVGCGSSAWVFGVPALVLGAAALLVLGGWMIRRGGLGAAGGGPQLG